MKLWEPSLCCCFRIRTGSIILGFLSLICGCFIFFGGMATCIKMDTKASPWYVEYLAIAAMVEYGLQILFSGLLLYGIFERKTGPFVPVMILWTVRIIFKILAGTVLCIIVFPLKSVPFGYILLAAAIMGLIIFLETYFLLVVRAHYYEIKRALGDTHTVLKEQNDEVPQHDPPPYSTTETSGRSGSVVPLTVNIEKAPMQ